jgi:hypothetical protein
MPYGPGYQSLTPDCLRPSRCYAIQGECIDAAAARELTGELRPASALERCPECLVAGGGMVEDDARKYWLRFALSRSGRGSRPGPGLERASHGEDIHLPTR